MPHGFAHGFFVLSDWADLHYKVSHKYVPEDERGINFADPEINIKWPSIEPRLNLRDSNYPFLKDLKLEL